MSVQEILNFLPISDTIGTAGQPTREQFATIRAAGYEVVVNLAMPKSTGALSDEGEVVAALGMEYVHIPVVWENPTLADLARFFEVMAEQEGKRMFLHCALNMRVSAFVLLYRVIHRGVPLDAAWEDLHKIWVPDAVWQQFIDKALACYSVAGGGS